MPVAAVPRYLGERFEEASPALRFGLLLPIWTSSAEAMTKQLAAPRSREKRLPGLWEKNDGSAREALEHVKELRQTVRSRIEALVLRQAALAARTLQTFRLDARAVAPFTTGLGHEHPLENGFAFLDPYGVPYVPGSGIKGVLRRAAQELASEAWGGAFGWTRQKQYILEPDARAIHLSIIDVLFGLESAPQDATHVRGALSFWDVIPLIKAESLMIDIMTPHQSHYYQSKAEAGSATPHDSGQPNPIMFLTVPPGTSFAFFVCCDAERLRRLTQYPINGAFDPFADGAGWRELLIVAFEHAFAWLGFGAKTAVGYGAMQRDREAEQQAIKQHQAREVEATKARENAERETRRSAMTPNMRRIDDFKARFAERAEQLRGSKDRPNTKYHEDARKLAKDALDELEWSAEERRAAADAITEWLPKVVQVDMKEERKRSPLLRGVT
jgi:CRISPR-associated protein Cmr6